VFKSSPFGSAFGGSSFGGSAFGGSALSSGPRLNFGKPGEVLKSDKPARPFGAPESDEDKSGDESNDDEDTKGDASSDEAESKDGERDDSKAGDDKKKPKLQKSEFFVLPFYTPGLTNPSPQSWSTTAKAKK
jgi:hypothetical protein